MIIACPMWSWGAGGSVAWDWRPRLTRTRWRCPKAALSAWCCRGRWISTAGASCRATRRFTGCRRWTTRPRSTWRRAERTGSGCRPTARWQGELNHLREPAPNGGLTDPQWLAELKELERLLDRAVTPELEQRLNALREALQKLDPQALREDLKGP